MFVLSFLASVLLMPTTALLEETVNRLCLRVRCLEMAVHNPNGWKAIIGGETYDATVSIDADRDGFICVTFVAGPVPAGEHSVALELDGDVVYASSLNFSGGTWWKHQIST